MKQKWDSGTPADLEMNTQPFKTRNLRKKKLIHTKQNSYGIYKQIEIPTNT
jgi:hypothetical protein